MGCACSANVRSAVRRCYSSFYSRSFSNTNGRTCVWGLVGYGYCSYLRNHWRLRVVSYCPLLRSRRHLWVIKSTTMVKKFATSTEENAFSFVLFTRLVPIFPFNGLNYACGLVPIGFKSYAIASFIGMLPGTFAYVYLGATGCKVIDAVQTGELTFGSLPEHVRNSLLTAIVLLGTLSLLPLVLKNFVRHPSRPMFDQPFSSSNNI